MKILSLFEDRRAGIRTGVFVLVCFVVLFHNLGATALFEPDEGRNAEVAREILLLRDWVTPHYDFIPYLDKPMFFYWFVAGAYKLFGVSEFSARLPSAAAALGCIVLAYQMARRAAGVPAALWSALILLTSPAVVAFSRATIFDIFLTFFVTLSLWSFDLAIHSADKAKTLFFMLMYAAMGCATLVKGPIGLVMPGMVIGSYLLVNRRWSALREMKPALGIAVFMPIAVSWYLWCELRNPGYLRYFLFEENLLRYVTPYFNRQQPWYYYAEVVAVGFFPWSALIYLPFRAITIRNERTVFLLLWIILPVLFFSFSVSKQPGYILPIFPPLSVLTGEAVASRLSGGKRWPLSIPWLILLAALGYFTLAVFVPGLFPAGLNERAPEVLPLIREKSWMLPPILMLLLACAGASLWAKPAVYFAAVCLFFSGLHLFALGVASNISETRSSRRLAEQALPLIGAGDQVVIYDEYLSSLPFYLRADNPILVVLPERRRAVMGSVYMAEKKPPPSRGAGQVVLTFNDFSELWNRSPARFLVFIAEKKLAAFSQRVSAPAKRVLKVGEIVLIANR